MDRIDTLVQKTLETIRKQRLLPESTYRLQFHAQFTFRDAIHIVPYLHDLGITHCYASPYLKARPGSKHGYDIIDHHVLNPEIGTEADYQAWVDALRAHGMSHILDMVPNHMGVVENPWWNDILENGPASPYASYFDIDWRSSSRPELQNRVLLPTLGDTYGKVLESQQIQLAHEGGGFVFNYFDHRFPVAPGTYELILTLRIEELEQALGAGSEDLMEYQSIITAIRHLPGRTETDTGNVVERQREKEVIKRRLASLEEKSPAVRDFITENVRRLNGNVQDRHSFDLLDQLLNRQAYRLAFWRVATDEINYRRFFDVNELAALSMEKAEVFRDTHEFVLRLLAEGKIAGLRIDHPDGLYDPKQYLERLQRHYVLAMAEKQAPAADATSDGQHKELSDRVARALPSAASENGTRPPLYVVVEKILGRNEPLAVDWATYGTSGYDFLVALNALFIDTENAKPFTRIYTDYIGERTSFAELVYQKKFLILQVSLSSELHMLAHQLDRLAQKNRASRDFTLNTLRHALREVIASFPVYRSYISDEGIHPPDQRYVELAIKRAKRRSPLISPSVYDFVRDMLLLHYPEGASEQDQAEQRRFAGKFQQVTSPVMAKGVEDTAFYVYNRLLSLNEVGGDPGQFGISAADFHRFNQERQARWPWALSALSTHDTKRSEDVRARLNVLSEIPEQWRACLERWTEMNQPHVQDLDETPVPAANEAYFIYQTLLGAWPLEPYSAEEYQTFIGRIQAYLEKALHEAKVNTSWINPNQPYDQAIRKYTERILDPSANQVFLDDFRPFQRRVSHYGLLNSLSQTLLKIASPGVPDTYQGTELWDLSLVDPDNRRPVDYELRQRLLAEQHQALQKRKDRRQFARSLLHTLNDGRAKLYTTSEALRCRRDIPGLFSEGEYLPAATSGESQDSVIAFARRLGDRVALVAAPRFFTRLLPDGGLPLGPSVWADTSLTWPGVQPGQQLHNIFTDETVQVGNSGGEAVLAASELFQTFPVALLVA